MKASVYVTDDLWEQARRTAGRKLKPSELVQEALKAYVEQSGKPQLRLVVNEPQTDDLFQAALAAVREGYEEDYRSGYEHVLHLARDLGYELLQAYEASGFDLVGTLQDLSSGEHLMVDLETSDVVELEKPHASNYLGLTYEMLEDPLHVAAQRGGARAMQDLWEALHSSDPTANQTDGDSDDSARNEGDEANEA